MTNRLRSLQCSFVLAALAVVIGGCGGADARKERYLEKGREWAAAGNFEKARLEYRNALQIDPNNSQIRFLAGWATEKSGNVGEAAQLYQGAIDNDAGNDAARARLALLNALAGLPQRALEILTPALQSRSDSVNLLVARGAALQRLGDTEGAMADAERAVQLAPGDEEAIALLSSLQQRAGRTEEAVVHVQQALKQKPRSVELRILLARLLFAVDRKSLAEPVLREVISLEPRRIVHRYRLAQLQIAMGNAAGAERTLREVVTAWPGSVEAKQMLANFLVDHRSFAVAEQELRTLSERAPADYELRLALGAFYESHERSERAEQIYRSIVAADDAGPFALTARNRLAAVAFRSGRADAARKLVDDVLALNPRDAGALEIRAELALRKGDAPAAIADLRTLLRDQPASQPLQRALARAYAENRDLPLAEETLRNALRMNAQDADTRVDLARLLAQRGRYDQARPLIEDLRGAGDPNLEALRTMVRLDLAQDQPEAALKRLSDVTAREPANAATHQLQGDLQLVLNRVPDAAASYQKAIDSAPTWWAPYHGMARALVRGDQLEAALKILQQGLGATQEAPELVGDLAELLERRGRADEAIRHYEALYERRPSNAAVANNLAMMLANHRTDPRSLARAAELTKPFESSPNAAFLDTHGWVAFKRGQLDVASRSLKAALQKSPRAAVIQYHLAMVQLKTGESEAAAGNLRSAVASGAYFYGVDDARVMLASLQRSTT